MKWFYKGVMAVVNLAMAILVAIGVAGGIWYLYDLWTRRSPLWWLSG